MDDLTPAYLGARLARMRLQLGQSRHEEISQRRLAHALDIKPQAYNSWEQGKALPRLDHLWRLARYYRVSLDRLCGYERDAEATGGSSGRACGDRKVRKTSKRSNCFIRLRLALSVMSLRAKWPWPFGMLSTRNSYA